jgi:hypothetical protein
MADSFGTGVGTGSGDITGNRPRIQSDDASRPDASSTPPHPRGDMRAPVMDGSFGSNANSIQQIPQAPPFPPQPTNPQPFRPAPVSPRRGPKG